MDVVAANKVEALKNEKMGPPGPCSSLSGSQYSMSRTYGTRDIISLVIPKLGDNRVQLHLDQILCSYWEILLVLSGYTPFTPHYN